MSDEPNEPDDRAPSKSEKAESSDEEPAQLNADDGDDDADRLYREAQARRDMFNAVRRIAAGGKITYAVGPALLAAKTTAVSTVSE
jgi:hypothetical protein